MGLDGTRWDSMGLELNGLNGTQWEWDSMGLNGTQWTQWDSMGLDGTPSHSIAVDGRRDVPAELRLRGGAAHVRLEDGRRRRALLDVVIEERCDLDHARADDGGNPRSTQYGTSSSQSMLIIIAIIAHHPRNQCTSSSQSLHIILAIIALLTRNQRSLDAIIALLTLTSRRAPRGSCAASGAPRRGWRATSCRP